MIVIVIYIFVIVLYGLIKKVNPYDSFLKGVDGSFKTVKNLFPNILAIILAINIFVNSGIIEVISSKLINSKIVPEIIIQVLLKPISWSSSLVMMNKTFELYGVDSFIGKLSSVLQGCSDTTIYIVAMYFSSINLRKTGHTMWVGLLADFTTFLFSALMCYFLLKV